MATSERGLPPNAYVHSKLPVVDGHVVHSSALEITRTFASELWVNNHRQMMESGLEKGNFQVAVVSPPHRHMDVTFPMYFDLLENPIGPYEVATNRNKVYPDGELELKVRGEINADVVYIVASIQNDSDYSIVRDIALHYKKILGVKQVNLIASSLAYGRQDKNSNAATKEYDGKVIRIDGELEGLSGAIDKIIAFEPHSSATQAFAAESGIILAPLSPWKFMIDEIDKISPIARENTVVVRPDKGRNIAATRLQKYLKVPGVAFDKTRDEGTGKTSFLSLTDADISQLNGREVVLYDDEGSSLGTIADIAKELAKYNVSKIKVCLVHGKFTPGWEKKLAEIQVPIEVYTSDSREPIGNIEAYNAVHDSKIQTISLVPLIRQMIIADSESVNFWDDSRFNDMVIQPMDDES